MSSRLTEFLATFFYIGYIPFAPGTFASLAGLFLAGTFANHPAMFLTILILITILGFISCNKIERIKGVKDPGCAVIDEVSGIMIALFLLPVDAKIYLITFFLFRAFDMFKIYPINRLESLQGGAGIMMDDIVSGLYANVTMQIALRICGESLRGG